MQLPCLCDTGTMHQQPKYGCYSLVGGHGSMRDQQPMGQKGQDVPWTGEVERGSVAAPCPLGSHSPSSPVLGVPFPILTPCLMPCPRPDAVLTSLTCTRAYTVCSSPCLCLGTGVPWVYIQTGRSLPSQGNGKGEWESKALEHTSVAPPPSRSCTPPSLPPSAMPASRTHGVLGSSQRQDMGLHPGAGLCNSHPQQT